MRAPRGQNLVLLALTLLFLALMVTMTIGLGLRIRQKHELQNIADAAAYSNAVMTARTYNNMALINRLEVSYWVAMSADESLLSWTAYATAMSAGARKAALELADGSCLRSATAKRDLQNFAGDLNSFITDEVNPTKAAWRAADQAAGLEAQNIQGIIAGLRDELSDGVVSENDNDLQGRLYTSIEAHQLTTQILAASQQTADISIIKLGAGQNPSNAAQLTRQEVDCDYGTGGNPSLEGNDPVGSGLCLRSSWSDNMLYAAMGSRGHAFLTGRRDMPTKVVMKVAELDGNYDSIRVSYGTKSGSGYWSSYSSHGNAPSGTEAWADDHGSVIVSVGGCSVEVPTTAHVKSTHLNDANDQHQWAPGLGDDPEPDVDHTMGDCTPLCPSVWVRTIGFQPQDTAADAWGQPKVMVALQRDLTARTFPWELNFKFPFSATGPASEWDGRGQKLHTKAGKGLNITRQTAFATGMAYYHRRGHWQEFPNLLNPFWRATLVPVDVDNAPRDVNRALSSPEYKWQRDAYDALRGAGFEGLH